MTEAERNFDDSLPGRVSHVEFEVTSLKKQVEDGFDGVNATLRDMQKRQQPNYGLYVGLLPSALVVVGACWWIVSSNIGQPLTEKVAAQGVSIGLLQDSLAKIASASAASSIADASSSKDREDIHTNLSRILDALNTEVTERSAEHAAAISDNREFETQFKMVSNTVNTMAAEFQEKYALLWEDVHAGRHYPQVAPFRPQLFNPNPQGEGR